MKMTGEERRQRDMEARQALVSENRAKFKENRVVYVTPNGMHFAHDLEKSGLEDLIAQLTEAKFTVRATGSWMNKDSEPFSTRDFFLHGDGDWWESYVITTKD